MEAMVRVTPHWPDAKWGLPEFIVVGAKTGFTYQTDNGLDVDARGAMFFNGCAPPKHLGAATFYLTGPRDAADAPLDGGKTYHLHVPPHVPAQQFWAVTVYDLETAAFIRESPRVELNSYDQNMKKKADGSVDVYFGPKAPAANAANWVYTSPGKLWFTFLRFYGPEKALFEKTWKLPDIEEIK